MIIQIEIDPNTDNGEAYTARMIVDGHQADEATGESPLVAALMAVEQELLFKSGPWLVPENHRRQAVDLAVKEFLAKHRESNGGYAEITERDMVALHRLLVRLIEAKCDPDPDRDYPVEFTLVDRRRFGRLSYRPVSYDFDPETHEHADETTESGCERLEEIEETLLYNLELAMEEYRRFRRVRDITRSERRRAQRPAQKSARQADSQVANPVGGGHE